MTDHFEAEQNARARAAVEAIELRPPLDFAAAGAKLTADMKRLAVVDRVRGVLVRTSGRSQETMPEECRLHEDLQLDSAERIETAMELEEEFKLELTDDEVDLACMSTVGGIADYLIEKRGVS